MQNVGMNLTIKQQESLKSADGKISNPFVPSYAGQLTQDVFIKTSTNNQKVTFKASDIPQQNLLTQTTDRILNGLKTTSQQFISFCASGVIVSAEMMTKKKTTDLIEIAIKGLKATEADEQIANITLLGKLKAKSAVPELVEMLSKNSTELAVSKAIINALIDIKDAQVVQPIIDYMMDSNKDESVRSHAALALGKLKNRKASKPLFELLRNEDENPKVRSHAAIALSEFPTIRNIEQLIESLKDQSDLVRANSALALGVTESSDAIPELVRLLRDDNFNVKANAALSLGSLKAKTAISDLIECLNDSKNEVIVAVAKALEVIGGEEVTAKLIKILDDPDKSIIMRRNATACLQIIKDKKSIDVLNKVVGDKTQDMILRNSALSSLIAMKAPQCLNNLATILNDPSENLQLKINSAAGIGMFGDEKYLDAIIINAKKADVPDLKINCLNAIRNIVARSEKDLSSYATAINGFLKDDIKEVKSFAANTLGYMKANNSIKSLSDIAINKDEDPTVRAFSIDSLGKSGDKRVLNKLVEVLKTETNHAVCSKAAAAIFNLGMKNELYNIINTKGFSFDAKNHAAGVLIANGEKAPELEKFLTPALNVKNIHNAGYKGNGVEAAVIDSVVDPNHPEFDNRVIIEPLEHGTMVAGNLGGNLSGVAPGVKIHAYNAYDKLSVDQILDKIVNQKINGENDIKVVNISLGYHPRLWSRQDVQEEIARFDKVAKVAEKLGITVVVAAGNDGKDAPVALLGNLNLLCLADNIIAVGATKVNGTPNDPSDDTRADFSSYPAADCPRQLDIMAPGHEITLPHTGGSYKTVEGTSFAAPFISGLVALMYEINPDITPAQVKEILKSTAVKLKDVPDYMQGAGEVQPARAIVAALRLKDKAMSQVLAEKLGVSEQLKLEFPESNKKFKFTELDKKLKLIA